MSAVSPHQTGNPGSDPEKISHTQSCLSPWATLTPINYKLVYNLTLCVPRSTIVKLVYNLTLCVPRSTIVKLVYNLTLCVPRSTIVVLLEIHKVFLLIVANIYEMMFFQWMKCVSFIHIFPFLTWQLEVWRNVGKFRISMPDAWRDPIENGPSQGHPCYKWFGWSIRPIWGVLKEQT